jgi:glycosyltransferase involved in cell wall biosynthesis
LKILFWTELYWPHIGGVEVRSHRLAVALRARGHEVAVVTSHAGIALDDQVWHEGIEIRRYHFWEALSANRLDLLAAARRGVAEFKSRFRPEVVHVFFTDPSVLFHWMTQAACKAPTIVCIPVGLGRLRSGDGTLLQRTLRQADWILAISSAMRSEAIALMPEVEPRCSVIYNSLDPPAESGDPLPFEFPILLCGGRLVREKGFDVAIQALPEILQRFPSAKLWIAGDGPERPELQKQAAGLGVASSVVFQGWVEPREFAKLTGRCTMVIVPSRCREAFGNVALQAMQMGRPVVATASGGLPEVVENEITGLITPVEDAAALASAAIRLLADPGLAERMGRLGRKAAARRFAFDTYVDRHEALYERIKSA